MFNLIWFIGVYSFCDGPRLSRGPYLGVATVCSTASLVFVSLKASYVFMMNSHSKGGYVRAMEAALFVSSLVLAIGHVVVAYRTSCRERRKLLVYKIDIEAVSQISFALSFPPKQYCVHTSQGFLVNSPPEFLALN